MDFGEEQTVQVEVQCIEGVDEPMVSFDLCEGSKGVAPRSIRSVFSHSPNGLCSLSVYSSA